MKKAAIFDMDGTLVANSPIHIRAFEIFCARYGVTDWREKLANGFGMGNDDIMRLVMPEEVIREKGLAARFSSSRLPAITKSYPFAASCAAYSRPIPDEAPVTNAYFRCREEIISNNLLLLRGLKICILCFGVSPPFCCSSSPTPL